MSKIKADLEKINNYNKKLSNKIDDYDDCVKKIYNRINNLENCWNGVDCLSFVDYMTEKKVSFEKISDELSEYNKVLEKLVDDINESI